MGECLFLVILAFLIVGRTVSSIAEHPELVIFLSAEILGVILIIMQRPGNVATALMPVIVGFGGTAAALMVVPEGRQLVPDIVSGAMILGGVSLSVMAKLSLRRSFGLVAANRGVKSGGLYRIVRHPMYMGYIINHIGYLLLYPSAWNVAVIGLAWTMLWMRTREEEKVLNIDPAYREYAQKVRSRLVPGLI